MRYCGNVKKSRSSDCQHGRLSLNLSVSFKCKLIFVKIRAPLFRLSLAELRFDFNEVFIYSSRQDTQEDFLELNFHQVLLYDNGRLGFRNFSIFMSGLRRK